MAQLARNLNHIQTRSYQRRRMGVSKRVEHYRREAERAAGAAPVARQVVRREGRAVGLSQQRSMGFRPTEAERQPRLKILLQCWRRAVTALAGSDSVRRLCVVFGG